MYFMCASIQSVCVCVYGEALKWIHAGLYSAWLENCSWPYHSYAAQWKHTHVRSTRTDTYSIGVDTHSWRQSKTEERQYSMRQESGQQSTIPASSYLVGSILETRPNQTGQVWSVKKHGGSRFSARTLFSLGCLFYFFVFWKIIAISTDIIDSFQHLSKKSATTNQTFWNLSGGYFNSYMWKSDCVTRFRQKGHTTKRS